MTPRVFEDRPLAGAPRPVLNSPDLGITELISQLQQVTPGLVVLEATGGFEVPVVVANPRQVRDIAKSTRQLAKTDEIDARILALFAERVRLTVRPLPDEATRWTARFRGLPGRDASWW